ncbi:MAG TPA: hypothetical protein EYO33_23120, partial [Phycisphaerales bacterium]|nr:hypothetical protein [Phycisphaerales bacterium]
MLSGWRTQFGFANRLLPEEEREKIALLSLEIGVPAAAEHARVCEASVVSWRKEFKLSQPREKPAKMRRAAVKRSVKVGPAAAAREYGVSLMTLCRWREMEGVTELPPPKFTETEKKKYAEMSLEVGVKEAALRAGVDRSTLSKWRKEFGVRSRAPLIS